MDLNKFIHKLTVKRFFNIQTNKEKFIDSQDSTDNTTPRSTLENDPDDPCLAILEELYNVDDEEASVPDTHFFSQYFCDSPPIKHTLFRPKSIFNPTPTKGPYVQSFYQVVYSDIKRMCTPTPSQRLKSNLIPQETSSFKKLTNNTSIIIKTVDKGGGIVI